MSWTSVTLFVAKRVAALAVLLLALSFGVFSLIHLAPGSAEQALIGANPSSPQTIRAIREQYHLDDPFLVQYWGWLRNALVFDFGDSIRTGEPVSSAVADRFGVTAFLAVMASSLAFLIGVSLGVLAALKRGSLVDRGTVAASVIGVSAPAFATGIFLLYVFAVVLGWFPVFGAGSGTLDRIWHLALPAIALALTAMALIVKVTRAALVTALEQDHVTFARARGLRASRIMAAYALRNALIPMITAGGLVLGYMLTGAVLVEVTFALPGIGLLLVESVTTQDMPVVQGIVILVAVLIVALNLAIDLLYLVIDPRIRFMPAQR